LQSSFDTNSRLVRSSLSVSFAPQLEQTAPFFDGFGGGEGGVIGAGVGSTFAAGVAGDVCVDLTVMPNVSGTYHPWHLRSKQKDLVAIGPRS